MQTRFAEIADVPALIRVRFAYFAAESWALTAARQEEIRAQLAQYFPVHLGRDFFAALSLDEDGAVASAAFLAVAHKPANPNFPTGKTGEILNVFTSPAHRRKGLATRGLRLLIKRAQEENLSRLELSASPAGRPVYEKLGFRPVAASPFTEMRLSLPAD